MVIYEKLEILPSYNALNTFNICTKVLWRLLCNLSHTGNGQNNCHPAQSLSYCQKYSGRVKEGDKGVIMNYGNTSEITNWFTDWMKR